jgi:hypothetical protein
LRKMSRRLTPAAFPNDDFCMEKSSHIDAGDASDRRKLVSTFETWHGHACLCALSNVINAQARISLLKNSLTVTTR